VIVATGANDTVRLEAALDELGRREIQDLLVEGGPTFAGALFDAGEIDEVRLFIAPVLVGAAQARAALEGTGAMRIADGVRPLATNFEQVGEDMLVRARLREW
jgi:diaminohydroxyphosphoribosylaminopyrimidine deaminase/5-amino-6-(5-phosphoribosylamino)uracil reductase